MAGELNINDLSDAIVILGAAGLVIPAFARFKITPIIGFILIGIAVGPAGLGSWVIDVPWLKWITITDPEAMQPFADFGIILLLFSIGLELSFGRLWTMRKLVFGVGAAQLIGSAMLIGGALFLLGQNAPGAMGLGLALALSSTALVLKITGVTSPVGKSALAILLFQDVAIVPIIFLLGAFAPYAADAGWDGMAQTLWLGALVIGVMMIGGRLLLPHVFGQAARTKSPEVFLAASLLVVVIASLATGVVGLSPIVGALLAGLLIAETDYHNEVEAIIAPFKGLALGVFLITVGMQVDLRVIAANWQSLTIAVVGVIILKAFVTGGLLQISGARRGMAAETGLLMASPSETTLIVLAAATAAQLIQPETAAFWQIVTAIGLTITPVLARIGHDAARRIELRSSEGVAEQAIESTEPRTIIIGFGRVGRLVADLLRAHNRAFIAVESDIDAVAEGRKAGYPVIYGDVSRAEIMDRLNLGHAEALVLTMDEPVLMAVLAKKVRAWLPDLPIIARARDTQHAAQLYRLGVTDAVPETLESSLQLSESVLTNIGVAAGPVIVSIHEKRDEVRHWLKVAGELDEMPTLKSGVLPKSGGTLPT
jgi:monovalent cation:H+ antiporter-2, CPA2 family